MPDKKNYHPTEIPESLWERMIKRTAIDQGTLIEDDLPYLEQYFHPEQNILENQSLRPSINPTGTNDTVAYKKPAYTYFNVPSTSNNPIDTIKARNLRGLGQFKLDTSNPNYDSLYDIWDFKTDTPLVHSQINKGIIPSIEGWLAKNFMQKVGTPYTVYDRFPKGTIYDSTDVPTGDIELPKETSIAPTRKIKVR